MWFGPLLGEWLPPAHGWVRWEVQLKEAKSAMEQMLHEKRLKGVVDSKAAPHSPLKPPGPHPTGPPRKSPQS